MHRQNHGRTGNESPAFAVTGFWCKLMCSRFSNSSEFTRRTCHFKRKIHFFSGEPIATHDNDTVILSVSLYMSVSHTLQVLYQRYSLLDSIGIYFSHQTPCEILMGFSTNILIYLEKGTVAWTAVNCAIDPRLLQPPAEVAVLQCFNCWENHWWVDVHYTTSIWQFKQTFNDRLIVFTKRHIYKLVEPERFISVTVK